MCAIDGLICPTRSCHSLVIPTTSPTLSGIPFSAGVKLVEHGHKVIALDPLGDGEQYRAPGRLPQPSRLCFQVLYWTILPSRSTSSSDTRRLSSSHSSGNAGPAHSAPRWTFSKAGTLCPKTPRPTWRNGMAPVTSSTAQASDPSLWLHAATVRTCAVGFWLRRLRRR